MTDNFSGHSTGLDSPASHAALVTPHDTNDLSYTTRALVIGTAGAVKVDTAGGETLIIPALAAGAILPLRVTRVYSTGTAGSNIVALW